MRSFGWQELVIILIVVLVIFGPKQLPKLGKMFGKTVKEVRTGMDAMNEELKADDEKKEETAQESEAKESSDE